MKYLSQAILDISVSLQPLQKELSENEFSMEMPLGMFADCDVIAPCGMTGKEREIETFDDPSVFFSPSRIDAECIWFDSGFITNRFPAKNIKDLPHKKLSFTFEICSETIYYNNDWPSDITIRVKIKLDDLKLHESNAVSFEIGVKEDAVHRGGLNLFGKNFGDFPQAIIMTLK